MKYDSELLLNKIQTIGGQLGSGPVMRVKSEEHSSIMFESVSCVTEGLGPDGGKHFW